MSANDDMREAVLARVQSESADETPAEPEKKDPLNGVRLIDLVNGGDLLNGVMYSALNGDRVAYDATADAWMIWAGHHWDRDLTGEHLILAERVVDAYLDRQADIDAQTREAIKGGDEQQASARQTAWHKEIRRRIVRLRTEPGRAAAVSFAATNPTNALAIDGGLIDQKPMLLPVRNGEIDLRTGELNPGRPENFLLKASPVEYHGIDVPCVVLDQFLADITLGDADLSQYIQRLMGYSITGLTNEHVFPVFSGAGRNGKTVLIEAVAHVLGTLSTVIPAEMLLDQGRVRSSSGPSPDIMALRGIRMAYASEADENCRISPSRVKWLTGNDQLTGRNPHDRYPTTFSPTHKLILLVNDRPRAPANDYAFWRRVHLIPFGATFVDHEPQTSQERPVDKAMLEKLKGEASGILAWLVRGCLKWQLAGGLLPPPAVRDATAAYQREEDMLGEFLDACCYVGDDAHATAKDLYAAFSAWWTENISPTPMSQKRFGGLVGKRFERVPDRLVWYRGIGLLA